MTWNNRRLAFTIALAFLLAGSETRANSVPRFAAMFADGSRHQGAKLTEWHQAAAQPKLDGRPLLDHSNPIRWLRDRSHSPQQGPETYVELVTGDRLTGELTGFVPAGQISPLGLPDHFLVDPDGEVSSFQANVKRKPAIRVLAHYVRRAVWQPRGVNRYEPGTAFYRDGRSVTFRSLRFGGGHVSLLLSDGLSKVSFKDLAEIHFPEHAVWESYLDEVAMLQAAGETRMLQLETIGGTVVTSSLARFDAAVHGDAGNCDHWVHGLHPVWSLDPIWISNARVWVRRLFAAHEVPLSRIAAVQVRQRSFLSESGQPSRRNRSVQGTPLSSGGHEFGWGFGVHARSELIFSLPPLAQSFRSLVGLDHVAGKGGCVRARVFLGTGKKPLFESGFIVGSTATIDTGALQLASADPESSKLILQMDPAHQGRPSGSDPLDIRDHADWLDPLVSLDVAKLKEEILGRSNKHVFAWSGWTLSIRPDGQIKWMGFPELAPASRGTFGLGAVAVDKPFSIKREAKLREDDNWLLIFASRDRASGNEPKLEVYINDEPVSEFVIPQRQPNQDVLPLAISLANYRPNAGAGTKQAKIEIRQLPADPETPVRWQAIQVAAHSPTISEIFEDDGEFRPVKLADQEPQPAGSAELLASDKHSGERSIKVMPAGQFRYELGEGIAVREKPTWGQFRYVRFAFRKAGKGRVCVELNHDESAQRPARFDAGVGDPCWGKAKRVWTKELPNEWIVMTRDLFGEFGALDVKGLTLSCPDGEFALFDHVYLARTASDFDQMIFADSADETNQKARRELAKPILEKILPATVAIDMGDGRFGTGTLVSADGVVLTAGHIVIRPNQDVKVRLADGRELAAKTGGVFRDMNIGIVKITDPGPYPFVTAAVPDKFPAGEFYLGAAHASKVAEAARPAAHILDVRSDFRGMIWTTMDMEDFSAGGPLVDREGRVIGVHARRNNSGGFVYSRLHDVLPHLDRIKNGEVWGNWLAGTGPMMGVEITSTRLGCQVTRVMANTPAAQAGFRTDDVVQKLEGQVVSTLDDVYRLLSDNDPGQDIAVEIRRSEKTIPVTIKLRPRLP